MFTPFKVAHINVVFLSNTGIEINNPTFNQTLQRAIDYGAPMYDAMVITMQSYIRNMPDNWADERIMMTDALTIFMRKNAHKFTIKHRKE